MNSGPRYAVGQRRTSMVLRPAARRAAQGCFSDRARWVTEWPRGKGTWAHCSMGQDGRPPRPVAPPPRLPLLVQSSVEVQRAAGEQSEDVGQPVAAGVAVDAVVTG